MAKCEDFTDFLTTDEADAWKKIKDVITNFLGNHRTNNFKAKVADMISALKKIGVNMSSKIHYLDDHVDDFPPNCGAYSDKQGERFHQDIALHERRYKGKNMCNMLGDYCWSLCRDNEAKKARR